MARVVATSWSKSVKAQKRASETIKRWHWSMETKSFTYTYEYDCIESRAINSLTLKFTGDLRLQQGPKFNWLSLLGSSFPHNTEKRGAEVTECLLLAYRWTGRRAAKGRLKLKCHRAPQNTCALLYDKATKAREKFWVIPDDNDTCDQS